MSCSRLINGTGAWNLGYGSHVKLHSMSPWLSLSKAAKRIHSDPFVEMAKHNKRYGYVTALWELAETVPTLFRKISDYKRTYEIRTRPVWKAMIEASYLPWPLRPLLSRYRSRDADGNRWNLCHFWSNFEIADMSFFRSPEYRQIFEYLDADGGFYYERVRLLASSSEFFCRRLETDSTIT